MKSNIIMVPLAYNYKEKHIIESENPRRKIKENIKKKEEYFKKKVMIISIFICPAFND